MSKRQALALQCICFISFTLVRLFLTSLHCRSSKDKEKTQTEVTGTQRAFLCMHQHSELRGSELHLHLKHSKARCGNTQAQQSQPPKEKQ